MMASFTELVLNVTNVKPTDIKRTKGFEQTPVAVSTKAYVCERWTTGIASAKPAAGVDLQFLCSV